MPGTRTSTTAAAPTMTQEEAVAVLLDSPLGAALKALIPGSVAQEPAAATPAKKATAKKAAPAPVTKTADDVVAEFLDSKNLGFAKGGRVYVTEAILEASARVLKTGKPEFVSAPDSTHTAGLLIARDDKGRTYTQNVRSLA